MQYENCCYYYAFVVSVRAALLLLPGGQPSRIKKYRFSGNFEKPKFEHSLREEEKQTLSVVQECV